MAEVDATMTGVEEANDEAVRSVEPKLRRRMQELMRQHHLPGAAVGVVRRQSLAWSAGFGFADVVSARRPDAGTLFRVASISKTFTATAIVQLRDQGKLRLDDPLEQHIPEFAAVRCHHGVSTDVTLRRLMSHRSGLISEGPFSYWDSMEFPTMSEILDRLPQTEVVLTADAGVKYSNLAFALLGEVVARISGEPYEEYIRRAIFAPLGMGSSTFSPEGDLRQRLATGYSPHAFEDAPEPSGFTPASGIAAAAGLCTTVSDLARWISLQFRAAPPALGKNASPTHDEHERTWVSRRESSDDKRMDVLAPRSLDEMHLPQVIDPGWIEARCLGWMGMRRGDNVYLGHGGSMHGFITQILFSKAHRTGVIVLTNEGRHGVASLAAVDLLELLLPAVKELEQEEEDQPALPAPAEWKRFLGRYSLWAGALTQVEFRDGSLCLAPPPPDVAALHAPARLAPTADPAVFRVTQGRAAGESLRFEIDAAGGVRGFLLSGFTYTRLG